MDRCSSRQGWDRSASSPGWLSCHTSSRAVAGDRLGTALAAGGGVRSAGRAAAAAGRDGGSSASLSPQSMDTEAELQFRPRTGKAASAPLLPEVETYLQLLLVIYLMNSKRYPEVRSPELPALKPSSSCGAPAPGRVWRASGNCLSAAPRFPLCFSCVWRQPPGSVPQPWQALCSSRGAVPPALTSLPLLQAQKVSDDLMQKISSQNRRALDLVVAKCYYYHSRIYEFLNKLDVVRRWAGSCVRALPELGPARLGEQGCFFPSSLTRSLPFLQLPARPATDGHAAPRCGRAGHPPEPAAEELSPLQPLRPSRKTRLQVRISRAGQQQRVGSVPLLHR